MKLDEAKQFLEENGYSLMEVSDSKMFDQMWEESNIVNQFMKGKIKHLDKLQKNNVFRFLSRKCKKIVYKKLKLLKIKPEDMDISDAGDYGAWYITRTEDRIKEFLSTNPETYFNADKLEEIIIKWNEDGEGL